MTSEDLNVRIILCILISIALASANLGQAVWGQNSTSTSKQQEDVDNSQTSSNSTATTSPPEQSNVTSTSNAGETNQTSTAASDQGEASGNATGSDASSNSTETESYQNSTSTEQQGNSTTAQSNNSTYSGNATGTEPENPTSYNSTQTMNQNATIVSNVNITDSAVNQTAALPPPDFDISIDPLTNNIDAGSSTIYTITISSINGFNADVSLAITSKPASGITASLSSNMTRPPANASSTLFLNVQSDPDAQSDRYKLRVTASSANMSDSSASVTLEVMGKNVTLDQAEQFDPIALTPVLIKDMQDRIIDDVSSNRMVLISTTVTNNYNKTQPFIAVIEVTDKAEGTTLYLQLQKGVLNPLGEVEVAISWTPEKAGTYQIRTFAIDELKEDPEPLSVPVGKIVQVK